MTAERAKKICQRCDANIPASSPGDVCPRCILGMSITHYPEEETLRDDAEDGGSEQGEYGFLGDYRLIAEIGRGGMGTVYKARQISLDRTVAVKTIHSGTVMSATTRMRFQLEAEAIGRLDHPGIVALYESGEYGGKLYYSMRYVSGGTFADFLLNCNFRPSWLREAIDVFVGVGEAVQHAHSHGILHRDLKPSNILLDERGNPQLTDFGIAKSLTEEDLLSLTGTSDALGTPNYMAPEQAQGKASKVTTATDVYSLGAILYQILTGLPPFQAATALETMRQVVDQDPKRPRELTPTADPDLEAVCLKCLEKDPDKRYPTAQALVDELERWRQGKPVSVRRIGTGRRLWRFCRRRPVASGLAAMLFFAVNAAAIIAIAAGIRIKTADSRLREMLTKSQLEIAEIYFDQEDSRGALALLANLSREHPDKTAVHQRLASALAYRSFPRQITLPHVHNSDVLDLRPLDTDGAVITVTSGGVVSHWRLKDGYETPHRFETGIQTSGVARISHSGERLAVAEPDGTVRIIDREGRDLGVTLKHSGRVERLRFSPDDRILTAVVDYQVIHLWDTATGRHLFGPWALPGNRMSAFEFSDDGERLVAGSLSCGVGIWDVDSGELVREFADEHAVVAIALSSGGRWLAAGHANGAVFVWDLEAFPVSRRHFAHSMRVADDGLAFTPDETRLISWGADHTARIWNLEGEDEAGPVLQHLDYVHHASLSEDGRWLATGCHDNSARVWDIESGKPITERIDHQSGVARVLFGPGGRTLLCACFDGTVWRWSLTGAHANPETYKIEIGSPLLAVAFSKDGGSALLGTGGCFALVHFDDHRPAEIFSTAQTSIIRWSPDGQAALIATENHAYHADLGQRPIVLQELPHEGSEIVDLSLSGDGRQGLVVTGNKTSFLRWSLPEGKLMSKRLLDDDGVYHAAIFPERQMAAIAGGPRLFIWDIQRDEQISVHLDHRGRITDVVFSPDGEWLLTSAGDYTARLWRMTKSGAELHGTLRHEGLVNRGSFSPDQRHVVTTCQTGYAQVWDVASAMPVTERLVHSAPVIQAQFDHTGTHVLTASDDGTVKRWALPPVANDAAAWLPDLAELVAGRSLSPQGRSAPLEFEEIVLRRERLQRWRVGNANAGVPELLRHVGHLGLIE